MNFPFTETISVDMPIDGVPTGINLDVSFREEAGFVLAYAPVLEVSSFGNDLEDARIMIKDAIVCYIEDMQDQIKRNPFVLDKKDEEGNWISIDEY